MPEQEPLDLSELDPMREPERWRAVVEATLLRVDAVLATRPRDPLSLIASWSRPLTLAACLALALLIPIEIMLERREAGTEQLQTLVRLSTQTALGEGLPTGAELSRALGHDTLP
jgi:hypothetical protein